MSRQINLLIRPPAMPLAMRVGLFGAVGVLLAVAVVALVFQQRVAEVERKNKSLRDDLAQVQLNLADMAESSCGPTSVPVALIARLKQERAKEPELWALVEKGESGSLWRHAELFAAISDAHADTVWLSAITVDQNGRKLALEGHALNMESVSRYAQDLNLAIAPFGISLQAMELSRPEASGNQIRFRLY